MMNREVLKNILVQNGDMYANDALQAICNKIVNADNYRCMQLLQKELDKELVLENEILELKNLNDANHFMIKLFNQIVSHGKEFAIYFINNNYEILCRNR